MTIPHLPELLTLDVRQLSQVQIKHSHRIFADFLDHEFLPANEAYHDPARQALDQAVLIDLLGLTESVLEPLAVLRRQWCAEPTGQRRQIHPANWLALRSSSPSFQHVRSIAPRRTFPTRATLSMLKDVH